MILSDKDIVYELSKGKLRIDPFDKEKQLQPASVDLRLDKNVVLSGLGYDKIRHLNKEQDDLYMEYFDEILIKPKSFILVSTIEKITLPKNICARVEGRSSIGRAGLFIQNAGWIDPGFSGNITLELFNASDNVISIPVEWRICQIVFQELKSTSSDGYVGKYQGQKGATASKSHLDK